MQIAFCSTLGLSKRTVASWLDVNNQNPPKPTIPKKGKCVPVETYDLNFLKNWLNGLPTDPSHYFRNVPAYQSKKFVYPGATKANLHAEYTAAATEAKARVVGLKYFSNVFSEKKFSVFIPRKDQCDICVICVSMEISIKLHSTNMSKLKMKLVPKKQETRRLQVRCLCGQWTCRQCCFAQRRKLVVCTTRQSCRFIISPCTTSERRMATVMPGMRLKATSVAKCFPTYKPRTSRQYFRRIRPSRS